MYSYDDIKLMFDWGCFTPEQVMEFVPLFITEDEFTKMTGKPFSKS
ncbi:XkdX family protein [Enterococcus faecalis]